MSKPSGVVHHFTVDVEEYFQVSAFVPMVDPSAWSSIESRVDRGMDVLLNLMAERNVRGTMFVLGWLADRRPDLVRRLSAAGHEIASHGWDHRRIPVETPEAFRRSVRDSRRLLEDLSGTQVMGFRAPSFSITPAHAWALDVLQEEGYIYDSSLFPIRRGGGYGFPGAHRDPHWIERKGGALWEVPPATLRLGGVNLPAAGGAYLRIFPYQLIRAAFRQAESRGAPGTFYIHPWELDPGQPRMDVPFTTRLRHYTGLERTAIRIGRLLREFRFGRIADNLSAELPGAVLQS